MKAAMIGLGSMGLPMAQNLLKAGVELTVWNRTKSRADELIAKGARWAETPAQAAQGQQIVITMVSKDSVLEEVTLGEHGFARVLKNGAVHVSMSTVSAETSEKLQAAHQAEGAHYLAAPVFGRPDAAAAKMLFILSAGPASAREQAAPYLAAMGQKTFELGDEPRLANIIKLCGNFMIMGLIESMGEALTLCEKNGMPRQLFVDILSQSIFPAPIVANYGKQIADQAYEPPRFKLELGLKDANLVLESAAEAGMAMPLAQLMQARFQTAVANGRGQWDWTGAAYNISADAGTKP